MKCKMILFGEQSLFCVSIKIMTTFIKVKLIRKPIDIHQLDFGGKDDIAETLYVLAPLIWVQYFFLNLQNL